jgi:hypothetical protein
MEDEAVSGGSAATDSQTALRHAIDRMHALAEESYYYHCSWQTSAQQVASLRKEAAALHENIVTLHENVVALHENVAALRAQWDALTSRRSFRLWQRLDAMRVSLAPRGSLRERIGVAGLRTAWNVVEGAARGWRVLTGRKSADGEKLSAAPPPAPDATPPLDPAPAPCEVVHVEESPAAECIAPADLTYAPLQWQLGTEAPPDDTALQLVVLSANHRAGSTLLQRICNARKETLIWGEHGGALRYFAGVFRSVAYCAWAGTRERDEYFRQGENPNLWIGIMCPDLDYARRAVVEAARAFLATFYAQYREGHDLVGFKEVLYGRPEIELLRRCYPKAHLLFLVRHPLNAWKSTPRHWWYPTLERWMDQWNQAVLCFQEFAAGDDRCHLIRYEDILAREPRTMAVLRETARLSTEQIESVLASKIRGHSETPTTTESEKAAILEHCRDAMQSLGYLESS